VCVSATVAGDEYRAIASRFMPPTRDYFESMGFAFDLLEIEGEPRARWQERAYPTLIEAKWEGMARALDRGCRAIIWIDTDLVLMRRLNASELAEVLGLDDPATHAAFPFSRNLQTLGAVTVFKNTPHALKLIQSVLRTSRTKRFPDGTPYDKASVGYEQTMLQWFVSYQSSSYTHMSSKACLLSVPSDLKREVRTAAQGTSFEIAGMPRSGGGATYARRLFFQAWGFYGFKQLAMESMCAECPDCGLSSFARAALAALHKERNKGFTFKCDRTAAYNPGSGGCSWRPRRGRVKGLTSRAGPEGARVSTYKPGGGTGTVGLVS
jgi:hypothetical protein